jgi:hypothetical protein
MGKVARKLLDENPKAFLLGDEVQQKQKGITFGS